MNYEAVSTILRNVRENTCTTYGRLKFIRTFMPVHESKNLKIFSLARFEFHGTTLTTAK